MKYEFIAIVLSAMMWSIAVYTAVVVFYNY